uniref:C2H2-type domain-containing protein n=2 Tax=Meloidogyne incognita TaxID=6306 RepID=A0A914KT85_MELIC
MTTEYDDENCGQLIIATDDELVDCPPASPDGESEFSSTTEPSQKLDGEKSNVKVLAHVDSSTSQSQSAIPDSTQISSTETKMDGSNLEIGEIDGKKQELKNVSTRNKKREKVSTKNFDQKPLNADKHQNKTNEENTAKIVVKHKPHGVHNFLSGTLNKKTMIDKSTCVFTRANGTSNGLEEHLLSMRPGTNVTIDITIICKSGGNTLYICAKWRGQEYHGVLTDGEPLFSHHHSQKRNANSNSNKSHFDNDGSGPSHSMAAEGDRVSNIGGVKRGGKRGGTHLSKPSIATSGPEDKRLKNIADNTVGQPNHANKQLVSSKSCSEPTTPGPVSSEQSSSSSNAFFPHAVPHSPIASTSNPSSFHKQSAKRRLSSASSSSQNTHPGLYEASRRSFPHRCPHKQCGFRFGAIPDLNTHLLIGHQSFERTKAAILESSATQTISPEMNSIGCDPFNISQNNEESSSSSHILCFKCKQLLTKEEKEAFKNCQTTKIIRPNTLSIDEQEEEGPSTTKKQRLQKAKEAENDDSPGFSDISDDAAPTLEKQEQMFDKQNDDQQASQQNKNKNEIPFTIADIASSSLTTSPLFLQKLVPGDGQLIDSATLYLQQLQQQQEQLKGENENKNLLEKSITSSTNVGRISTDLNNERSQQPQQQTFNETSFPFSVSSNIDPSNLQPGISATMFGQQNPFAISQLQAFVAANQQQSSASPKFLNPSSSGLLSLGTPMSSTAAKLDANAQIHHKIYELQEHANTSAVAGGEQLGNVHISAASRSSSTKPLQSQIGSTVSPIPSMRPNSAIASGGVSQQQRGSSQNDQSNISQNLQQHHQNLQKPQQLPQQQQPTLLNPSNPFFLRPPSNPGMAFLPSTPSFVPPSITPISAAPPNNAAALFAIQQQMAMAQQQQQAMRRNSNNNGPPMPTTSGGNTLHQQQQIQQQQIPTSMFAQPFGGQMQIPPGLLAASGIDFNVLQQYTALINQASGSSGGALPQSNNNLPHIQQQQNHNQK